MLGGVHDRGRNARRTPGTVEGPVLGRGGAQGPAVHGGLRTLQARRAQGICRTVQGQRVGFAVRQHGAGAPHAQEARGARGYVRGLRENTYIYILYFIVQIRQVP